MILGVADRPWLRQLADTSGERNARRLLLLRRGISGRSGVGLGVFYRTRPFDFATEFFAPVAADVEPLAVDSWAESEVDDLAHLESGEIAAGVDLIKLVSCLQLIHLGFAGAAVDSSIGTAAPEDVSVAANVITEDRALPILGRLRRVDTVAATVDASHRARIVLAAALPAYVDREVFHAVIQGLSDLEVTAILDLIERFGPLQEISLTCLGIAFRNRPLGLGGCDRGSQ
jgi:hypothetical protein